MAKSTILTRKEVALHLPEHVLQQVPVIGATGLSHATEEPRRGSKGRVLMISEHADPLATPGSKEVGGQNVYVYHLARQLGRLGWDVDVYTRWDSPHKSQILSLGKRARVIRIKCGPRHYIPRDHLFNYLPEMVDNIIAFKREKKLSYDVIHTHYWMSGWVGLKLRSVWDIPLVVTYHSLGQVRYEALKDLKEQPPHNDFFRFRVFWEKHLANKADLVLSTSPFEEDDLQRYYSPESMNLAIAPAGIDPKVFYPVSREVARRTIGVSPTAKLIMYAGRIEWRKGIETLIEAFSHLKQDERCKKDELRLLIVGRKVGPERKEVERLKKLAEQVGVLGQVTFVGSVEQSNMKYYYSAADVCAVPSYYEPFGIVPLEAMACNCPVIASQVGGLQYTVKPGKGGLLVPPKDAAALASALAEALETEEGLRRRLRLYYATVLSRQFVWPQVARSVESLYSIVIGARTEGR